MKRSLLFFDVDGTVIPLGGKITESTLNTIKKLKENGHIVFVNTGRCYNTIPPVIFEAEFDGIVSTCGTLAQYKGEKIFEYSMSEEEKATLIEDFHKYHIDAQMEGNNGLTFVDDSGISFTQDVKGFYAAQGFGYVDYHTPGFDVKKFSLFFDETSDIKGFVEKYQDKKEFMFMEMDHPFYEVSPKGYSKGEAMKVVADYLQIDAEDIYAFGDSGNDLAMLKAARHSIAMGNASDLVKKTCEFVTHDCADDGIEFACRHYGLID